ncbi:MAG: Rpn family recombination-promoting nuclease/putative transposase, partial [Lachnospiraceae bacterium]|nr:Rpn family recombination-promoting nuclease/putative transposase [Lachnospiraceae bacterium]
YWNGTERFADFFNAVLYDGQNVIGARELAPDDTDSSTVLEYKKAVESLEGSRDKIKIHKKLGSDGKGTGLLGLEFQDYISYLMPLKMMGYDYSAYHKLYKSNAEQYQGEDSSKRMTRDEFLSRMKKEDRLMPIINIVVYYGQEPWDGPTALHEMLDIPPELERYVGNYRMLLVEVRNSDLKLHNDDNIDLFGMLRIALDRRRPFSETRKRLLRYEEERNPSKDVMMVVCGLSGVKMDYDRFEREGGNMRTVFDDVYDEGKAEGKIEGRAQEIVGIYREQGLSDEGILEKLQTRLCVPLDQAKEFLRGKQMA